VDQGPEELLLSLGWEGPLPLRGVALNLAFDPEALTFLSFEGREVAGPLTWTAEERPGELGVAAGLASSQEAFGADDLGVLVFERHSDAPLTVRPLVARGFVETEQGRAAVPVAAPSPVRIAALPAVSALHPAYPNPFNPETVISFSLARRSDVQVRIFDLLGRQVATLVDEPCPRGRHAVTWRADDDGGRPLAAGVYLVELRSDDLRQVRKLMLIK